MSLWECAQKSSFLICFCSRNAPEIIRGRQLIEKAHMPHNIGSLNFKKYKFAEWQICTVSAMHAKRSAALAE